MTASSKTDLKSHTDVIRGSIEGWGPEPDLNLLWQKKKNLVKANQILVCVCPLPQTSSSTMRTRPGSSPKDQMPREK